LGKDADNVAVRLALSETQLIVETKQWLKDEGVRLDAFEEKKSKTIRSKTVIIVKNIPFNTEEAELRRLFVKLGSLGRIVLPPSRTMALVEFIESSVAQRAFKSLAYKKFKHVPLYLEWAPSDIFLIEKKPEVKMENSEEKKKTK